MRHSIIFGGIDSADFGIYIGGEGTFNAPERDVEMISIPGRDGAFALDKGRFENIEVKYTVINQEPDLATFSANLEGFRNALCSQRGYQRLEDTFHPDEYRMAVFADKFEVKPIEYNTASKFDIVFNCKPQRYLTDGETAVSVEDGDTLTNPTLFEASPMLEVEGYGAIDFNGFHINIDNAVLGAVTIVNSNYFRGASVNIASPLYNTGDTITVAQSNAYINVYANLSYSTYIMLPCSNASGGGAGTLVGNQKKKIGYETIVKLSEMEIVAGTDSSKTDTFSCTARYANRSSQETVLTAPLSVSVTRTYDASTDTITWSYTYSGSLFNSSELEMYGHGDIVADSTISLLGNPTYIDCDLGEAYKYEDGVFVSLNRHIDLGSKLPTLAAGSNEITYDNTITDLQIVPRWWRV